MTLQAVGKLWKVSRKTFDLLVLGGFGSQLLSFAVCSSTSFLTSNSFLFFFFPLDLQFTETFLTERDKQSKWSGIPQLLLKLYATSHLHSDFVECQNILKVTVRGTGGAAFRPPGDTRHLGYSSFSVCFLK